MTFLTDFADQGVVLPVAFAVAVALLLLGWRRGMSAWLTGVFGTLAVMLVLKLLFGACGHVVPDLDIRSPSGHTAAAAVTYGGMFALLGASSGLTVAIAFVAAVAFGISRVVLGFHTPPEVVVGAIVGLSGAALIARLAGPPPPMGQGRARLLAAFVVVLLLFHGAHVHAETSIGRFARLLELWPLAACRGTPAA